ncbi:hypothetical protein WDZ92_37025, partial [Nostoc sp. NIES-2111]
MRFAFWMALSAIAVLAGAAPAWSAEITKDDGKDGLTVIIVDGELELGDEAKFAGLAVPVKDAVVLLAGPGGNLRAGLEIGKAIRLKGFATWVPDQLSCASACALAWLGGTRRAMADSAKIGFHAAWVDSGGGPVTASSGNALVGAYLVQLGLSERAIVYLTKAPPTGLSWLTFAAAQANGIEVRKVNMGEPKSPPAAAPSPAPI